MRGAHGREAEAATAPHQAGPILVPCPDQLMESTYGQGPGQARKQRGLGKLAVLRYIISGREADFRSGSLIVHFLALRRH